MNVITVKMKQKTGLIRCSHFTQTYTIIYYVKISLIMWIEMKIANSLEL